VTPWRSPEDWLQWLPSLPESWREAPRYVPVTGRFDATVQRHSNGRAIVEPGEDGRVRGAYVYADESAVVQLDECR
jgi:hypothetical protein